MANATAPLWPRYPEDFGCFACRHAFGPPHFEERDVPAPFVPISQHLRRRTRSWTRRFYACRECEAIWLLTYSPKEGMYEQTRTPLGMGRALLPEASLDDVMVPLFALAPVGDAAEQALWALEYEPQDLWDRLLFAWRHPDVEAARKAIILRQLVRLLRPNNPHHRKLLRERGWLLSDLRGFERDLIEMEEALAREDGPWDGFPHAKEDLAKLRQRIAAAGTLPREEGVPPESPSAPPPMEPAATTLAQQVPPAESTFERTLELLRPYWNYLPAILLGWFLVELVGGRASGGHWWLVQSFLLIVVLLAYGVSVALSARVGEKGFITALIHRLSVIGEFLYFLLVAFLAGLIYVALAWPFDPGLEHEAHQIGAAAAALVPLVRLWPFWVIPFMQPVEGDIKSATQMGWYRRPALATAWRMTGEPGTFRRRTLPWFLGFGIAVALTVGATWFAGVAGRSLVLYPLVLPFMAAFTWALTEPMPDRYAE